MKKLALASLAAVTLASSTVYAADLATPVYKSAPPLPPPATLSWTGCYVDGGGGYGLWNEDLHGITAAGASLTGAAAGGRGWYGTVGGGCDYQAGNWVVGLLGDYDFMNIHGTFSDPAIDAASAPFTGTEREHRAWAAGGRIGYLVSPNVLSYFSAGFTQARFDQINMTNPFFVASISMPAHDYNGWFLGGGFETSLAGLLGLNLPHGLFLRTEYRYSSYQPANLAVSTSGVAVPNAVERLSPYVQTITTALVYKFNDTGH